MTPHRPSDVYGMHPVHILELTPLFTTQYSDNQATLDRHVGEGLGERLMPDRSSV